MIINEVLGLIPRGWFHMTDVAVVVVWVVMGINSNYAMNCIGMERIGGRDVNGRCQIEP